MDHPHARLVERFYAAFEARDADAMAACYHPDVVFEDPVFGELRAPEAAAMWRMLVVRGKDLRVRLEDVRADDAGGAARWSATYTFGRRRVHNVIRARFAFRDGLIVRHRDAFSLWRWAGMALGPAGWALGWTPPVRARIRRDARKGLEKAMRGAAAPADGSSLGP